LRVLLVQSPTGRPEAPIFPLGLAFLAGQLAGRELRGLDLSLPGDPAARLRDELGTFAPDAVCISLRNIDDSSYPLTWSYIDPFARVIEALDSWEGTVIVGGTGFSIYPERLLDRFSRIDFGMPGECEETLPALLSHLESGGGVQGWDGGRLLPWGRADLDRIAPPEYGFLDTAPYSHGGGIGVQSRRGCGFGCTYCTYGYLSGKVFRPRPVAQVMEDIARLGRMGIREFQFVDSVFNAPPDYFEELLSALESTAHGLSWGAWLDEGVTPAQLARMKAAGAVKVDFSPDAITNRGLRLLGKRSGASDLHPAVQASRKAGLITGVNFFSGNPGEGLGAFLLKILFMLRVRLLLGWADTPVNIGTIRVYAHSPMALQMEREGAVEKGCDFFRPVFRHGRGPGDWLYRLFESVRRRRHG
jgi:radical SAM superfamily enzyme YgiQ (UPF0313 family)